MNILLRLKHWQLFGLLLGGMFITQFLVILMFVIGDVSSFSIFLLLLMMVFSISIFFGWYYSVGTGLNKKLPESVKMNLTLFKVFLLIPIAYMAIVGVFVLGFISTVFKGGDINPISFAFIIPFHLFSMFCLFYCLYFNAKSLKAVELQREVTFNDYAGEFFLLWFYPIGIWIIQPRINKIFR